MRSGARLLCGRASLALATNSALQTGANRTLSRGAPRFFVTPCARASARVHEHDALTGLAQFLLVLRSLAPMGLAQAAVEFGAGARRG